MSDEFRACVTAVDALADAWASIDGKLDEYRAGRNAQSIVEEPGGHFSGYQYEAAEMIGRLEKRGFVIVAAKAFVRCSILFSSSDGS